MTTQRRPRWNRTARGSWACTSNQKSHSELIWVAFPSCREKKKKVEPLNGDAEQWLFVRGAVEKRKKKRSHNNITHMHGSSSLLWGGVIGRGRLSHQPNMQVIKSRIKLVGRDAVPILFSVITQTFEIGVLTFQRDFKSPPADNGPKLSSLSNAAALFLQRHAKAHPARW